MTVVISFHRGDVHLAISLLEWIKLLGKHPTHNCLLVVDCAMEWGSSMDTLNLANEIFRSTSLITNDKPTEGWIPGSCSLFAAAAQHMESIGEPFLWVEPDATPLHKGWLDAIAAAYQQYSKPFLGSLVTHSLSNRPNPYFEGCGVYPANTWSRIKDKFILEESWTLWCAEEVVPHAVDSPLFQHFWGVKDLAPTFVAQRKSDSPVNALTLADVRQGAALFHRCKDQSLLRLMRDKLFPVEQSRFLVVLPFCAKDAKQIETLLSWMMKLGGCPNDVVILAYEENGSDYYKRAEGLALNCFRGVAKFAYPKPSQATHPQAPNHVFREVAKFIQNNVHRPWLWFEPDMVPIKRGWLDALQAAYKAGGMPFFGSVVPGMGHFNGTGIYPANTYSRCAGLNVPNGDAFDTWIHTFTKGQVMDGTALMAHGWVQENGKLQPHGAGELPVFKTVADVQRIPSTAVTFHRDKTLSLIDRLSEMGVA